MKLCGLKIVYGTYWGWPARLNEQAVYSNHNHGYAVGILDSLFPTRLVD